MKKVEEFLRGFSASLAAGKMYPVSHPQFRQVLDGSHQALVQFLNDKDELIVGIIEGELVFEDQVLFKLSSLLNMLIEHVRLKNIEKVRFARGITEEELVQFLVLLLEKGDMTIEAVKDRLVRDGISHITISGLTTPLEQKKKERLTAVQRYENLVNEVASIFVQMNQAFEQGHSAEKVADIKFAVINLRANFSRSDLERFYLVPSTPSLAGAQHAVCVGLLAMSMAQKFAFSSQDVIEVGTAALLHEMAVPLPSGQLLDWPPDTQLTTEMLLHFEKVLSALPVVTAFETGRAFLTPAIAGADPSPAAHTVSQITALSCLYDRWQRLRAGRQDLTPPVILREVTAKAQEMIQNDLMDVFWQVQGLWPVGTIVLLSDDRVAIVREQHPTKIDCPTVQVLSGENTEMLDLDKNARNISIREALSPFHEGQRYVEKI